MSTYNREERVCILGEKFSKSNSVLSLIVFLVGCFTQFTDTITTYSKVFQSKRKIRKKPLKIELLRNF